MATQISIRAGCLCRPRLRSGPHYGRFTRVFQKHGSAGFRGIPELESTVSAYGYPIGGERMSVTTGIVSRIDFQLYTHSSIDQHLAIQISAQINPGNSGGPVMLNGKVVGVAFQGYSGDVARASPI